MYTLHGQSFTSPRLFLWSTHELAETPSGACTSASQAANCWVGPSTWAAHVHVPTVWVTALLFVPFPAYLTHKLNGGPRLHWGHTLNRLLHDSQSAFDVAFTGVPLVTVPCVVADRQTYFALHWIPYHLSETSSIDGGVDH